MLNNGIHNLVWAGTSISYYNGDGDSLVDTPTNGTQSDTGAGGEVVGNYATLNPLVGGAPTNGNLHQPNNSAINYATIGVSSGKWYFETTIDTQTAGGVKIGVAQAFNTGEIGDSSTGWAIVGQSGAANGKGVHAGALTSSYTTYAQGDIVNCAFDMDSGKIYWGKNGTWLNSGNPATGAGAIYSNVSGTVFPAATANQGGALSWNFGQRAFAFSAPTNFKALNTSSLPTPTIADGRKYFDTKLWTGNSSTRTISGYDFSPDFAWIKVRSEAARSHFLFDTIRGATNVLKSDATDAEQAYSTSLTAFNSDGFDLGAWANVNNNTKTIVGWAWDAGSSNTTIAAGGLNSSVYDQSQNWTSGWVSEATYNNGDTFDGILGANGQGGSNYLVWSPASAVSYSDALGGVEVYTSTNNAGYNNWAYKVNPASTSYSASAPSDLSSFISPYEINSGGSIWLD